MKENLCYSTSINKSCSSSKPLVNGGGNARLSIVVLGSSSVGKTALTVQYLTGRFIGDYCSGQDMTYRTSVPHLGGSISTPVEIVDTSHSAHYDREDEKRYTCSTSTFSQNDLPKMENNKSSHHHHYHQAYLVVYSLTDATSFDLAKEILQLLPSTAPKFLAANQLDLQHRRQVPREEGQAFADRFGRCHFGEFSAADPLGDPQNSRHIKSAFGKLIRQLISSSPQCVLAPYCPRISFSVFSKLLSTLAVVKARSKLRRMTLMIRRPSSETGRNSSATCGGSMGSTPASSSCSSICSSIRSCSPVHNNPSTSSTSSLISSDGAMLPLIGRRPTIDFPRKEQANLPIPILNHQRHLGKDDGSSSTSCYPINLMASSI